MQNKSSIDVISCHGTMYEIGCQYGEACGSRLGAGLEQYLGLFRMNPVQPSTEEVRNVALKFLDNAQSFDPEGIEFIKGQADGARLDFVDMFILHCMIEVLFNYQNLAAMCTSFAVTGAAARAGKTIVGQNVDWFESSPVDLLRIRYSDGLEAFALCLSGVPYYHLTSAGLANCANLTLGPPPKLQRQVPLGVYLPKAMRQKNLTTAFAILKETACGYGYYHLADGDGNILGIESIDSEYTVISPVKNMLVHANHYETEKYRHCDWTEQLIPCTHKRSARMLQLLEEHYGEITPQIMMNLLCDHANHPYSICKHPDPSVPPEYAADSRASIIMVPADRLMYLSFGPPCEKGHIELSL